MRFTRTRFKNGCIERKERRKGPDVWVFRYREQRPSGSATQRSVILGTVKQYRTKSKAREAALSLLLTINANASAGRPVTFGAVIDRYFKEELPERTSTARRYRSWLERYVKPKWSEQLLGEVRPRFVEAWLKELRLAPKSKAHLKSLMRILYNCAMRWEFMPIGTNPMSLVRVKDSSKRLREPVTLTVEQFRQVIRHIAEPYKTMCIVAACLGLRVSEVLGLQWDDFDWQRQQAKIQRSWVDGQVGTTKTEGSRAWMPVDPLLGEVLMEHRRRNAGWANENPWVFASPRTGKPSHPWSASRTWLWPAGVKAGVGRIGWHTFRHSYSTLLNEQGTDLKVQQSLLRHADIRTTMNIYTRAVPDRLRQANSKVVSILLPGRKTA